MTNHRKDAERAAAILANATLELSAGLCDQYAKDASEHVERAKLGTSVRYYHIGAEKMARELASALRSLKDKS